MTTDTSPETPRNPLQSETSRRGFGRRAGRFLLSAAAAVAVIAILASCLLFVDEMEYVIIERLGQIQSGRIYDRPDDRGLHLKWPWPIETVRRFDRRVQLFDPPGRELFTRDKKNITVDAYVCWKIAAPTTDDQTDRPAVQFYRSLGDLAVAEARLDARIRPVLNTQISRYDLSQLLGVSDSSAGPQDASPGLLETIADDVRRAVMQPADRDDSLRERLGIEVVDVRIKRLNLPLGNRQAVFERMKSERRKWADEYRTRGMTENKVIRSQADRQYNQILARARADAERTRGEAQAQAIAELNRAHTADPEFYRHLRTLDVYRKILNEKTTLVLSSSSNLLRMLTEGIPPGRSATNRENVSPTTTLKPASGETAGSGTSVPESSSETEVSPNGADEVSTETPAGALP